MHDPTPDDTATLLLGAFDRHGTTRARHEGRWIEVEHGIPGETVLARIVGQKRPMARIVEVLDPAPDRVEPPCPYFRDWACGGCQWQQMSYEGQLERKRAAIDADMRRAGHDLAVTALHALDDPWRYRSTAGIALGRSAGFRRRASLAIVPLHDCPISHPSIGRLAGQLNDRILAGSIPDYRGRVRVDVRVVGDGAQLQTMVRPAEGEKALQAEDVEPLTAALSSIPDVAGVSVLGDDGSARVVSGELFAPVTVAGRLVWLTAASFFQTNLRLLPVLIDRMREEAAPLSGKRVVDVYGGVGIFGLFLAGGAEAVVEIESDPLAIEAGRLTAERWGVSNVEFVREAAEVALPETSYPDVVIVDPPRAGLTEAVIGSLTEIRPPLILYVSCLPSSLARDLIPLAAAGYRVDHLELFDFYPQTYHTEVLAVLRLPERSPWASPHPATP